jgi:uncharacterized protein (DUF2252 family)
MLESPFAFLRGSAIVQATDLAKTPESGIIVQAGGDCHLMNFGGFATPERNLIFDINDFDETLPAPFEWDVKRLTASIVVAARWRKFSSSLASEAVLRTVRCYRERIRELAEMPALDVWYAHVALDELRKLPMGTQTSEHVFHRTVEIHDGVMRIADQPPLVYHSQTSEHLENSRAFLEKYAKTLRDDYRSLHERFKLIDVAMKVVGVGSVGTRCFVVLLVDHNNNPLFLQIKEARESVLTTYPGAPKIADQGQRVVSGQRLMQAQSDIFLGWSTGLENRHFYVRQLRDQKFSADLDQYSSSMLELYARTCGLVLARAHAKAGQAARIAGYLGTNASFDDAIERYATGYADQVDSDFKAFQAAAHSGRIATVTE